MGTTIAEQYVAQAAARWEAFYAQQGGESYPQDALRAVGMEVTAIFFEHPDVDHPATDWAGDATASWCSIGRGRTATSTRASAAP